MICNHYLMLNKITHEYKKQIKKLNIEIKDQKEDAKKKENDIETIKNKLDSKIVKLNKMYRI